MIVGGAIMLFALAGYLAFYFWGQIPYLVEGSNGTM
jgi:hypothetical protein